MKVLREDRVRIARRDLGPRYAGERQIEPRRRRRRIVGGEWQAAMRVRIEGAGHELHGSLQRRYEAHLLYELLVVLLLGDAAGLRRAAGAGSDRGVDEVGLVLGLNHLAREIRGRGDQLADACFPVHGDARSIPSRPIRLPED